MTSITIHDDQSGDMVKLTFQPTDIDDKTGEGVHVIEQNWVTDIEAIKKDSTPIFKSSLYVLLHAFGLTKKEAKDV